MKNYTPEQIEAALRKAGFSEVSCYHHSSKPWITVIAEKTCRVDNIVFNREIFAKHVIQFPKVLNQESKMGHLSCPFRHSRGVQPTSRRNTVKK